MKNTAKDFESVVLNILPALVEYLEDSLAGTGKVLQQLPANELAKQLDVEQLIKNGGIGNGQLKSFLGTYLANSQHMHHPAYIGHQVSSHHLASGIADLIQGAINNPMAIYEMGPSAAVIEQVVLNWMLEKAGWFHGESITDFRDIPGNGGGILTHGGSMANLTAMLAARAKVAPNAWDEGTPQNLAILGSEVAHYSIARAISIIGLGKKALIPVAADANEVLIPDDLPRALKIANDQGKIVMAVNANACATTTGLYDPIEEVGHFCKENNLWFHVDGAHGASALVSEDTKHYLRGLDMADSMIWDTHKMLRTTTLCAAVLFKDATSLHKTFQQKGSYLFHEKEQLGFDLMAFAIECTKAAIGTKLFWVLASEGEDAVGNYVADRYEMTQQFYELIHHHEAFECPYRPEANIICFRYNQGPHTNDFQLQLRNKLVKNGNFYITSSEMNGVRYLRMTVINALTDTKVIKDMLAELQSIAKEITG